MRIPPCKSCARRGAAIIVVLLFIVLLTVLALAFFMRATAFRGLSQSAVNDFKSDTLARSALALTVSDLKREIAGGSDVVISGTQKIYLPKTNSNAIPLRSGNPAINAGVDPIPNLIRRSVRSDTIASPGVGSRASAASSATPSHNGRYISAARWNKHYLIPRDPTKYGGNPSLRGTDPVADFVTPDWVFVTDKGPTVLTASSRGVIGRFAFAIYDEGGLLDINVAGYPSNVPVEAAHPIPNPHNLTNWGTGAKRGAAFADLTVLGLSQTQIDQLAGWKTYASAQPSGSFPNFTFDLGAALRFHDLALFHPTGFQEAPDANVTVGGTTLTDQIFTSRQQFLQLSKQLDLPQDALQYLGTFSRSLDQPGYVPESGRPRVRANASTNNSTWGRGNDKYNLDRDSDRATDINPPFPLVRVKAAFTRPDGTSAAVGEPLVKHRFPLSRLGEITRTSTAGANETDAIYRNFGLSRGSTTQPWTYEHGGGAAILRLDEVASKGREPDFFELLKAAIQVGSVGKAAPLANYNLAGSFSNIPFLNASYTDLHILQIGANIIDQADVDGYPTRIRIADSLGGSKEVVGIEDLPYLYSVRNRPSFPTFSQVRWLMQPLVWNPHDPAGRQSTDAPTSFRIRAELQDPAQPPQGTLFFLDGQSFSLPSESAPVVNFDTLSDPANAITFRAGEQGGYPGFRQPTRLGESNVPVGSQAAGNTFTQANVDPAVNLVGIVLTEFPVKWPKATNPAQYTYASQVGFTGPAPGINFFLEYQDGSSWVQFDQFPYSWQPVSNYKPKLFGTSTNTDAKAINELALHYSNRNGRNMIDIGYNSGPNDTSYMGMIRMDPRTQRWASTFSEYINFVPDVNVAENSYESFRGGVGLAYGLHHSPISGSTDRAFIGTENNNYQQGSVWGRYRGLQIGYWAENSTRATRQDATGSGGSTEMRRFNRDPDGVPRRAMGGYATDPESGGDFDNLLGLPMATNNFASRPVVLNRPFQSVAELGHVFRGEPWKNLSFGFPESGDSALLDVFCLEEPARETGIVAGRVNLNTRQAPVLQALLAGTMLDPTDAGKVFTGTEAKQLADALVARTMNVAGSGRKGPLVNIGDLVGRWAPEAGKDLATDPNPDIYYSGFSADIGGIGPLKGTSKALVPRQREAAIRTLSQNGESRIWNLLIDVVAQSGSFPTDGASLDSFVVAGEKRYWLHVALDRITGEIIDQQLELVTE